MKIHMCDQLSPEWWQLHEKRMTASHAQAIAAQGAGLKTYIQKLMQEYYSTGEPDKFSNHHTDRGNDLEDSAGFVYSAETKIKVQKVGFVELNSFVGCSPDLFAGEDGLCEIKALGDKGHFALILGGNFDSGYVWQCQDQMLICEKNWCDLVSYNANYEQNLIIKRLYPDAEKFKKLQAGFIKGKQLIEEIERKMEAKQ